MAIRQILLLGNPKLYQKSEDVKIADLGEIKQIVVDLHDTMLDFRQRHGMGGGIAAPQIGVMKRLIYMFDDSPSVFINPVLSNLSNEMVEVWDDCMCFPDIRVKVSRHKSCSITYRDLDWKEMQVDLSDELSQLLQHEVDHLNGELAMQKAVDTKAFALRSEEKHLKSV